MKKNIRMIQILILKEIRDILRDKKTLIIMVAVPLILYPALIIGMALFMSKMMSSDTEQVYQVLYEVEDEEVIRALEDIYEEQREEEQPSLQFISSGAGDKEEGERFFDVWMEITDEEEKLRIILEYNSTNQNSSWAGREVKSLIEEYEQRILEENLAKEGLTADFLTPIHFEMKDTATQQEAMGISIGGSLGMLLMVTIMMGAFYPVIDVTTGEKERGTLETLLTLPITNFQMIMSKFVAVSVFACATAVLSLLSLGGSVAFLVGSVAGDDMMGIAPAMLFASIPLLLVVVLVTALLLTAVSMCFCVFAKSFKEANNYITPVMLIVMFASMVSMLPSVELDYTTALIPIVNVSLLIKQVVAQQMSVSLAGITIAVNLAYSILVIWILSRIYNSENVLFRDGFQSFSLFEKRSDMKPGTIPKTGDLILAITVLLLLILYMGTAVSVKSPLAGTLVNQVLILVFPLILTWYMKTNVKELFSCNPTGFKNIAGSVFLYLGTFCLTLVLSFVLTAVFTESTENLEQSFGVLMEAAFPLLVLVIAVMPAVGEELFFRGLLLGSWKHHYGVIPGILLSSLVFGAFHMSLVKLLPTALLGVCFAYITCRTGSIFPAMGLHFLNNLVSLLTMKYPKELERFVPVLTKTEISIKEVVVLAVTGILAIVAGLAIMKKRADT